MKYELLQHAFYMANHIPSVRDMLKLHFQYNAIDVTAKPPTKYFLGAVAKLRF